MLPRQPELHVRVAASLILERVSDRGIPRAVYFKSGRLVDYPAIGTMARNHMSRNGKGVVALGVYDDEATIEHILEEIGIMNQGDLWPSTSN